MNPQTRRFAYYVLPPIYGIACLIGFIISSTAGIIVAIAGVVILAIIWTGLARGGTGAGAPGGRQRNRNRNRDRS